MRFFVSKLTESGLLLWWLCRLRNEELLNVKLDPELVGLLKQTPGFLPAYHMNKATWISIRLKQIAAEQIKDLLAQSYDLTQK